MPIILGLHRSYVVKTNTWKLNGKVTEGGLPVPNFTVSIARGITPAKLTQRSSTKTAADGTWKTAGHLSPRKTTYFRINGTIGEQDYTAQGCQSPAPTTVAPAGCVSATISPWSAQSAVLKLNVPKAKPVKKKK